MWRGFALTVTGMLVSAAAAAQVADAPPAPPPTDAQTVLAFGASDTRMTLPVSIGGQGPWRFIVDTGAERTVIARELAGVLGLAPGPIVRVTGMTGTSPVPTVLVPRISVDALPDLTDVVAPALEARNLDALGMIGLDALQGNSIAIDFDTQHMTLRPARRQAPPPPGPDEIVVTARSVMGQLIVTHAHWRRTRIAVVLDTGSPVSIGNAAMLAAILKRPQQVEPVVITSATGGRLEAPTYLIDRLEIGGIQFGHVPVAISDTPPFRRFGLGNQPALMLGMDLLRQFRRVAIDFPNRRIRLTLPRAPDARPGPAG